MLKKIIKWFGIVLGVLVLLIVLMIAGLYINTTMRLAKTYNVQPAALAIPQDPAAIERGKRWASIYCAGCHGDNLAGTVFLSDPSIGRIPAPNLTAGNGGVAPEYTDIDWVRVLRDGVEPSGKPVLIMPSSDFYYLSDGDLADIIAYVKSVPKVDNDLGDYTLAPMAYVLLSLGAFGDAIPAETINQTGARPSAPAPGATAAYGDYLVKSMGCRTCHGKELAGGKDPNPQAPPVPNITPGGELQNWSEADFIKAMRTGVPPSGKSMTEFMPWKDLARMSDDELRAIFFYLKSLPASPTAK
jgi:mono/diheme cytochrome c family protein